MPLSRALLTRLGPVWGEEATDEVDGFIAQHAVPQVQGHKGRVERQGWVQQGQPRICQGAPMQARGWDQRAEVIAVISPIWRGRGCFPLGEPQR